MCQGSEGLSRNNVSGPISPGLDGSARKSTGMTEPLDDQTTTKSGRIRPRNRQPRPSWMRSSLSTWATRSTARPAARPAGDVRPADRRQAAGITGKVRDGQVASRPDYAAIGVTLAGEKDILGLGVHPFPQ